MTSFVDKLDAAAKRNRSLLVVGLDPWRPSMPVNDIGTFTKAIVDATADLVCAFKPNSAFYEAEGIEGMRALEATMKAIPSHIPVILDAKRGDIGNTAQAYAKAAFEIWGADATTVNAWGGRDSVEPFLAYRDKGIFIWVRSSNPGGAEFQSLPVHGETPLYEYMTREAQSWNQAGNVGLVVGATAPGELAHVRALCPTMPLLIPGVGAQGGDLEASVRNGMDGRGRRALINASRQVIYAAKGAGFAEAARDAATRLRDAIGTARGEGSGFAW